MSSEISGENGGKRMLITFKYILTYLLRGDLHKLRFITVVIFEKSL